MSDRGLLGAADAMTRTAEAIVPTIEVTWGSTPTRILAPDPHRVQLLEQLFAAMATNGPRLLLSMAELDRRECVTADGKRWVYDGRRVQQYDENGIPTWMFPEYLIEMGRGAIGLGLIPDKERLTPAERGVVSGFLTEPGSWAGARARHLDLYEALYTERARR